MIVIVVLTLTNDTNDTFECDQKKKSSQVCMMTKFLMTGCQLSDQEFDDEIASALWPLPSAY